MHLRLLSVQFPMTEPSCGQLSTVVGKTSHWSVKLGMSWYQSNQREQPSEWGREGGTEGFTHGSTYTWEYVAGCMVKLPHIRTI